MSDLAKLKDLLPKEESNENLLTYTIYSNENSKENKSEDAPYNKHFSKALEKFLRIMEEHLVYQRKSRKSSSIWILAFLIFQLIANVVFIWLIGIKKLELNLEISIGYMVNSLTLIVGLITYVFKYRFNNELEIKLIDSTKEMIKDYKVESLQN